MTIWRECAQPECSTLVRFGYCEQHARKDTRDRRNEPWRALYTHRAWKETKKAVRVRAGERCEHYEGAHRCPATKRLSVHHRSPLHVLWVRAGGHWESFLPLATNPECCALLCGRHHSAEDARLRDETYGALHPRDVKRSLPRRRR